MEAPTPGQVLFRVQGRKVVVPAARAHRADIRQIPEEAFENDARVVIQAAGDGRVQREGTRHLQLFERGGDIGETLDSLDAVSDDSGQLSQRLRGRLLDPDEIEDILRGGGAGNRHEQLSCLFGPDLALFVDGAQYFDGTLREAPPGEERIENAAVRVANGDPLHAQRRKAVPHEEQDFEVRRGGIGADDVEIDLHELAVAAPLRVFTPPDLCGVPAAEGEPYLGEVGCHEPGERDREVEAHRDVPTAMVGEPIDLLVRLPAAFSEQDFGKLEDGRIDRQESEPLENGLQPAHEEQAMGFLVRKEVAKSFRNPGFDELVAWHGASKCARGFDVKERPEMSALPAIRGLTIGPAAVGLRKSCFSDTAQRKTEASRRRLTSTPRRSTG